MTAVDSYLDDLADALHLPGAELGASWRGSAEARRILAEVEDHLRTSVEAGVAGGLSVEDAEAQAIDRFGSARAVARRFRSERPLPVVKIGVDVIRAGMIVVAIGLVTLGVSGLASEALGRVFGADFVAGDAPGVTYTATRCADFFEYAPHAPTCAAAAAYHHWGETVEYRVAVGVLGLLMLGGLWLVERRRTPRPSVLPDAFGPGIGAALAGAVAIFMLGNATDLLIVGGAGAGAGAFLADGVMAALASTLFAVAFVHRLRLSSA